MLKRSRTWIELAPTSSSILAFHDSYSYFIHDFLAMSWQMPCHDGRCHLIHSYVHSIFTLTWYIVIAKTKYTVKCWLEWLFVCNSSCSHSTPTKNLRKNNNASKCFLCCKLKIKIHKHTHTFEDRDYDNCAAAQVDVKLCRVATHETCRLVARSSFKHRNIHFSC